MYDINNDVAGSETEENLPQAQEEVRKEERKQCSILLLGHTLTKEIIINITK